MTFFLNNNLCAEIICFLQNKNLKCYILLIRVKLIQIQIILIIIISL